MAGPFRCSPSRGLGYRLFRHSTSRSECSRRGATIPAQRKPRRSTTLVLPSEVGAGISQMVPIIIAALVESGRGLALVEQPEIHVHPALQVGLGDIFLDAATRQGRQFLIETHSEHLLLRLMHRMRET